MNLPQIHAFDFEDAIYLRLAEQFEQVLPYLDAACRNGPSMRASGADMAAA